MARTVHIIGAGLAGLAAAVKLAPSPLNIVVHEATAYPGGRCRSYFDRTIGMTIDNGNHLVLSGNHAVLDFAKAVGSTAHLVGPETAEFTFVDLSSSERWRLRISDGLPWWIFDPSRRVPGTRLGEYLRLARLLWAKGDVPLADAIECSGPLYQRLIHPTKTTVILQKLCNVNLCNEGEPDKGQSKRAGYPPDPRARPGNEADEKVALLPRSSFQQA